jgi:hypothetical protein
VTRAVFPLREKRDITSAIVSMDMKMKRSFEIKRTQELKNQKGGAPNKRSHSHPHPTPKENAGLLRAIPIADVISRRLLTVLLFT